MPTTLLEPTTGAAQSSPFNVDENQLPCHVYSETLGAGETGIIQINVAGTYQDYQIGGVTIQIDENNTGRSVYAPGRYRVNKSATAGATGVYLSTAKKE